MKQIRKRFIYYVMQDICRSMAFDVFDIYSFQEYGQTYNLVIEELENTKLNYHDYI